jgi:hypothetical protein
MTRSNFRWAACAVLMAALVPFAATSHPLKAAAHAQIPQTAVAEMPALPPGYVANGNLCAPGVAIPTADADGARAYICSPGGGGS